MNTRERGIVSGVHTKLLSKESATILKTAAALKPVLIEEHPEIADLYRETSLPIHVIAKQSI